MPYQWSPTPDAPHLSLWPHQSLGPRGFTWFIGITAATIALPLIAMLGSPVWWGLLPPIAAALTAIWFAIRRNAADQHITEELHLTPDTITLHRRGPRKTRQEWQANPHWVQVTLYPTQGPVPHYLTLRGGGREVELGAFLSEEERLTLSRELRGQISALLQVRKN